MSNLKRVLSLALVIALVVSLGLSAMATGVELKDKDTINPDYQTAVNVLNATEIMQGTDGNFRPTDSIMRAELAKMVYVLYRGGVDDKASSFVSTSGVPFTDIGGLWYEGYAKFCYAKGIVSGYGDANTFAGKVNITGYEFLKMMLTTIGYDGATQGYQNAGDLWTANVMRDAMAEGLVDKTVAAVDWSKPVAREVVAKVFFNMLGKKTVVYDTTKMPAPVLRGQSISGKWASESLLGQVTVGLEYLNLEYGTGVLLANEIASVNASLAVGRDAANQTVYNTPTFQKAGKVAIAHFDGTYFDIHAGVDATVGGKTVPLSWLGKNVFYVNSLDPTSYAATLYTDLEKVDTTASVKDASAYFMTTTANVSAGVHNYMSGSLQDATTTQVVKHIGLGNYNVNFNLPAVTNAASGGLANTNTVTFRAAPNKIELKTADNGTVKNGLAKGNPVTVIQNALDADYNNLAIAYDYTFGKVTALADGSITVRANVAGDGATIVSPAVGNGLNGLAGKWYSEDTIAVGDRVFVATGLPSGITIIKKADVVTGKVTSVTIDTATNSKCVIDGVTYKEANIPGTVAGTQGAGKFVASLNNLMKVDGTYYVNKDINYIYAAEGPAATASTYCVVVSANINVAGSSSVVVLFPDNTRKFLTTTSADAIAYFTSGGALATTSEGADTAMLGLENGGLFAYTMVSDSVIALTRPTGVFDNVVDVTHGSAGVDVGSKGVVTNYLTGDSVTFVRGGDGTDATANARSWKAFKGATTPTLANGTQDSANDIVATTYGGIVGAGIAAMMISDTGVTLSPSNSVAVLMDRPDVMSDGTGFYYSVKLWVNNTLDTYTTPVGQNFLGKAPSAANALTYAVGTVFNCEVNGTVISAAGTSVDSATATLYSNIYTAITTANAHRVLKGQVVSVDATTVAIIPANAGVYTEGAPIDTDTATIIPRTTLADGGSKIHVVDGTTVTDTIPTGLLSTYLASGKYNVAVTLSATLTADNIFVYAIGSEQGFTVDVTNGGAVAAQSAILAAKRQPAAALGGTATTVTNFNTWAGTSPNFTLTNSDVIAASDVGSTYTITVPSGTKITTVALTSGSAANVGCSVTPAAGLDLSSVTFDIKTSAVADVVYTVTYTTTSYYYNVSGVRTPVTGTATLAITFNAA